ncbi:hypothetical protein AtNW77_Chr3g0200621 [Arabidopsis thaliana]
MLFCQYPLMGSDSTPVLDLVANRGTILNLGRPIVSLVSTNLNLRATLLRPSLSLALQAAERSFFEVLQDQTPISGDLEDGSLGNFSSITSLHQPEVSEESTRRYRHRDDDEDDDLESGRKSKLPAISTVDELAEKFEEVLLVCQKNDQGEATEKKTRHVKAHRIDTSSKSQISQ